DREALADLEPGGIETGPLLAAHRLHQRVLDPGLLRRVAPGVEAVDALDPRGAGAEKAKGHAEAVAGAELEHPCAVDVGGAEPAVAEIVVEDPVHVGDALLEAEAAMGRALGLGLAPEAHPHRGGPVTGDPDRDRQPLRALEEAGQAARLVHSP